MEEGRDGNKNVFDKEKGFIEIKIVNRLCILYMRVILFLVEVVGLFENKSDLIKVLVMVLFVLSVVERK